MRILIVDDQQSLLLLLTTFFEDIGYAVVTARNGHDALIYLRHSTNLPGLILLDVAMPTMTGWQFLREQQRDACLAAIPVVLMTALGQFDYEAVTPAVVAYLQKPLDLNALAELLHAHYQVQLQVKAVGA